MRRIEIEAIGNLAGETLAASCGLVQEMHEAIAQRPFEILGTAAAPVRVVHDGITRGVYRAVRLGLRVVPREAAGLAALSAGDTGPPLAATPAGSVTLAALNGLYGDHLAGRGNRLALAMELRGGGAAVPVTPAGLASAFPDATSRIAVFVHGLCETDEAWRQFPLGGDRGGRRTYGERLRDELGFTPVHVRYNSGLRISRNGRALALLLDELVEGWPTNVAEVVLVGHSMGGLVARSACHYAAQDERRWADATRHVFCLGAPHLGTHLEKGLNVISWALGRVPETRAWSSLINARSVGIKDLRFGACVDEDWRDSDPDEFLRDRCHEVPFLPDAHYYFVAASVREGALGSLVGDVLVRIPSASGRGNGKGRRIPFVLDNGLELSGLNHFDLLNHPAVYEQIRTWVSRAQANHQLPASAG